MELALPCPCAPAGGGPPLAVSKDQFVVLAHGVASDQRLVIYEDAAVLRRPLPAANQAPAALHRSVRRPTLLSMMATFRGTDAAGTTLRFPHPAAHFPSSRGVVDVAACDAHVDDAELPCALRHVLEAHAACTDVDVADADAAANADTTPPCAHDAAVRDLADSLDRSRVSTADGEVEEVGEREVTAVSLDASLDAYVAGAPTMLASLAAHATCAEGMRCAA